MSLVENISLEYTKNPDEIIGFLAAQNKKLQEQLLSTQDQLTTTKDQLSSEIKIKNDLAAKIEWFEEQIKLHKHQQFSSKSENLKMLARGVGTLDIFGFFDEPLECEKNGPEQEEMITVPEHKRKKQGRKPLPKELPVEVIKHELPEEERTCKCCGEDLIVIGEDKSERLRHIPEQFIREDHRRHKYACKKKCQNSTIKMAPLPKRAIPKSIATEELLTEVIIAKYEDHMPLYRQEKRFLRSGIEIDRTNLSNWIIRCAELCEPIVDIMIKQIQDGNYTNADETPVKLLKENGEFNTSDSYMFVYVGGDRAKPNILYDYCQTRKGKNAEDMLGDFKGHLQTDAFSGYNRFKKDPDITLVGCWAHARRKFFDVAKVVKHTFGLSHEALKYIDRLYKVEKKIKKESKVTPLSPKEIKKRRRMESKPILRAFKKWLIKNKPRTSPKSGIGKAMTYLHNNWDVLNEYITDGQLLMDNNIAERAIRPFALGRKNWLFCGNEKGAKASAILYSLIETCKANEIRARNYILHILKTLPNCDKHNPKEYENLTPQAYQKEIKKAKPGNV